MRDASAGLETMNSGGQDIDFWAQQVVLGADKLHAGTADSFLYGRPSPPTHQPSPTHHRVHPVPPSPRHPPAPVYLRELNALSGLPHGITSYIRDLDLVSGPEYHAGSRHGVVTVETALAVHTLKGVLLHWRSEDALGRRRTARNQKLGDQSYFVVTKTELLASKLLVGDSNSYFYSRCHVLSRA